MASTRRHPGILLYGMYDVSDARSAPKVRISMMLAALTELGHTESITGGRFHRAIRATAWLLGGGPRRVGAVYVEAPTSSPMPWDLCFLAAMRLLRRPVGVYFRDAHPLFRGVHPRTHARQRVTDLLWRVTTPMLKRLASVRFAPSSGLASVLGLADPVLLPPGGDPNAPDLGPGPDEIVGAILQIGPTSGFARLLAAMEIVRRERPSARLRMVSRSTDGLATGLPDWVEVIATGRSSVAEALRPARVCVLPLPINVYTNLAVAVRLYDLASLGKPIVATDTAESRRFIEASGAGLVAADSAQSIASAITGLLSDRKLAEAYGRRARAYACSDGNTWAARARTVRARLLGDS
jgi:glycosyltransferase involved in cell wall biosynthesis